MLGHSMKGLFPRIFTLFRIFYGRGLPLNRKTSSFKELHDVSNIKDNQVANKHKNILGTKK